MMGKIKSLFENLVPVKGSVTLPAEEYRNLMLENYLLKNLFKLRKSWSDNEVELYVTEEAVKDIAEALLSQSEYAADFNIKEHFYTFSVSVANLKSKAVVEEEDENGGSN